MGDACLAEELRTLLKPARGFAPKPSHIRAALLGLGLGLGLVRAEQVAPPALACGC